MIIIKKIFLFVLSIVILCSCSAAKTSSVGGSTEVAGSSNIVNGNIKNNFSSPDLLFSNLIADRNSGELTADKLWEVYISDLTKSLQIFTKEEFIALSNANRSLDTIKGYSSEAFTPINGGKYAKMSYTLTTSSLYGEEKKTSYEDWAVLENGQWKLLLLGMYKSDVYPRNVSENDLSISSIEARHTLSGVWLSFSISNRTDSSYAVGFSSPSKLELVTDTATYELVLANNIYINSGADYTVNCFLKEATGNLKEIKLSSVYKLDETGLNPLTPNKSSEISRNLTKA